jgi:hypothetical protein
MLFTGVFLSIAEPDNVLVVKIVQRVVFLGIFRSIRGRDGAIFVIST